MRSGKSHLVFKSFKELKGLLDRCAVSLPAAPPVAGRAAPAERPGQTESQLFESAMSDVTPISHADRTRKAVHTALPKAPAEDPDAEALSRLRGLIASGEGFVVSDTPEYIEGTGYQVPGALARQLHRGNFSVQAFIDLHGLNVADAREAFEAFLANAVRGGKRGVLVIHGRGLSSPADPVLKTRVYQWLTRSHWRKWVIAFASARSCDGGAGATYVLLRQRPVSKLARKESTIVRSERRRQGPPSAADSRRRRQSPILLDGNPGKPR